jgi:hypothetical protein
MSIFTSFLLVGLLLTPPHGTIPTPGPVLSIEQKLGPVIEETEIAGTKTKIHKLGNVLVYEMQGDNSDQTVYGIKPNYDMDPKQGVTMVGFLFPELGEQKETEVELLNAKTKDGKKVVLRNVIVTYENGGVIYTLEEHDKSLKFITIVLITKHI